MIGGREKRKESITGLLGAGGGRSSSRLKHRIKGEASRATRKKDLKVLKGFQTEKREFTARC